MQCFLKQKSRVTWNPLLSFGFPMMTAQGQAPALDSVPPTIRVASKNPHGVFSGVGGTGDGVVVTGTVGAGVVGFGLLFTNCSIWVDCHLSSFLNDIKQTMLLTSI
jgi:hypothetical protein